MSPPVWFITGVSNGFGQILAHRALDAGHRVIGSVRNRTRAAKAVEQLESQGGKIVDLDTTEPQQAIIDKMKDVVEIYGQVDILVNNAAYAALGVAESFSDTQVTQQFQTNVFGPLYVIQGVLPSMRSRKSGMIVNISSFAGQYGGPADGIYAASKFALEGLTESLWEETSEFGIKWLLPEFGTFRTNLLGKGAMTAPEQGLPAGYEGSKAAQNFDIFDQSDRKQLGDPGLGVNCLFEVITGTGRAVGVRDKVLRFPIGADAIDVVTNKLKSVQHDLDIAKEIEEAHSTAA